MEESSPYVIPAEVKRSSLRRGVHIRLVEEDLIRILDLPEGSRLIGGAIQHDWGGIVVFLDMFAVFEDPRKVDML